MFCFYGFLSFYWILEKSFEVIRNIKKFRLEEAGPSYDQKFVFYFIPGQNIWNKNSVKLGKTWKLLYLILSILSLPLSNFNFWQEGYVPTQIWFFFLSFLFPEILCLRLFDKSEGNSYFKFVIQHLQFRFAYCKAGLCYEKEFSSLWSLNFDR